MNPKPALIFLSLLGGLASAQSLTVLGEGIAQGIAADGTTVVGGSNFNGAWRWTSGGGQQNLSGSSWAYGVSGDGTTVFGEDTGSDAGAVWTMGTGWQSIGGLVGGSGGCPGLGSPYNISDTGDVAVGLGWDGCSAFAYKWTPGGGLGQLGQLGPNSSRANDVSGDGTTIGGWDEASNGSRRAAVWFSNGTEELILEDPGTNPTGSGEVWGLSTNGTWACGSDSQSGQAFRWSQSTGVELIGSIPSFNGTTAMAISDDGATVVGFAGIAFFGITAFIWTESGGIQRFADYAANFGISLPAGEDFQVLHDMTPDGFKVVGYYAADAGPFSTKTPILFDLPTCPGGAATVASYNGTDINLDRLSSSPVIVGAPLTVTLTLQMTRGPGSWFILVRDSSAAGPIIDMGLFLLGVSSGPSELLVAGGVIANLVPPPHAGGGSSAMFTTTIPNNCGLVGVDWFMQALVTGNLPGAPGMFDPWFSTAANGIVGTF